MSYYEQAAKINERMRGILINMTPDERKHLINTILWFGQVVKFRCRSNAALDGFTSACFRKIARIERVQLEGFDFEVSQATKILEIEDN